MFSVFTISKEILFSYGIHDFPPGMGGFEIAMAVLLTLVPDNLLSSSSEEYKSIISIESVIQSILKINNAAFIICNWMNRKGKILI